MANQDLQGFLETRLRALDPSIDVSAGSPAQTQFIEPVLKRLGTDPFETDIDSFLNDRFAQEFPDIYAADPSVVRDVFVKPLIVLLTPFKREIQAIKLNQSLQDPTTLSDDDADAIVANFFDSRDNGGFATGSGRIYFANPITLTIDVATRFFSVGGLNYFPISPSSITAEEMVFNREGSLFYADIPLRAEDAGADYNIGVGQLTGVDGVYAAVKVTNTQPFSSGASRQSTPAFLEAARASLTERSLNTRRGATARLLQTFKSDISAVQIIGAGDEEMQRDLLIAASPGHQWLTGTVVLYKSLAYIRCKTVDGEEADAPKPGDTLYVYISKAIASIPQQQRLVRLTVGTVFLGPLEEADPYQISYLLSWSGELPVTLPLGTILDGGLAKNSAIQITSFPSSSTSTRAVSSGVHVYGHTDIYARPIAQAASTVVLDELRNDRSRDPAAIERSSLITIAGSYSVSDATINFIDYGVEEGDTLTIFNGADSGTYQILGVSSGSLVLPTPMSASGTVRYSVTKSINVDAFSPKVRKYPFGTALANNAATTSGSSDIRTVADLSIYSAVGDTFRITNGLSAGDYLISGFISDVGGFGVTVNKVLQASESSLTYEVFRKLSPISKPLVRIKEIALLDSAARSTGITVPPADAVGVIPLGDFTSASVRGTSLTNSGFVLPDMATLRPSNVPAPSGDRRYSMGFDPAEGTYYAVQFQNLSWAELLFRDDACGSTSYFVATVEIATHDKNYPPIDPNPGESLDILSGPNKGSYLIKAVHKFKYFITNPTRENWVYFIQIHGSFKVDVFSELISFMRDSGMTDSEIGLTLPPGGLAYPTGFPGFFSSWFSLLGSRLREALSRYNVQNPPSSEALQAIVESQAVLDYSWGTPSRGVLRTFFTEPTLFEQHTNTSENPTLFDCTVASGSTVTFRPDVGRYPLHTIFPPRGTVDTDVRSDARSIVGVAGSNLTINETPGINEYGIKPGDYLNVHEELQLLPLGKLGSLAVVTEASSNIVSLPSGSSIELSSALAGNYLFIEEGADAGGYLITDVVGDSLILDKTVSITTPTIVKSGGNGSIANGTTTLVIGTPTFEVEDVGRFVTIYGTDYRWMGSYEVASVAGDFLSVVLTHPTGATFTGLTGVLWCVTEAPTQAPSSKIRDTGSPTYVGTDLVGLQMVRLYSNIPTEFEITTVADPSESYDLVVNGLPQDGYRTPYSVVRHDIRRINPSEMELKKDGSLFYFDTEVVSLTSGKEANIPKTSYLSLREGTYRSWGYSLKVTDASYSYSTKEDLVLTIPSSILTTGVLDGLPEFINLTGMPVQVSYEQSDVISVIQNFVESAEDRVTSSNMLVRHFLPAYVTYDATYLGGSVTGVVAKDIIEYLKSLPIETPFDVSVVESLISKRGGNVVTPTKVTAIIHDWARRRWMILSENELTGDIVAPGFSGSSRVTYFVAGPDYSGRSPIPLGERVSLVRL